MSTTQIVLFSLLLIIGVHGEISFHYLNNCAQTIWLSSDNPIDESDPVVTPGTLHIIDTPENWKGSIWARTKCVTNSTYYTTCETGDCGSGTEDCTSTPPTYPVTQLNFNVEKNSLVSYEVSLNHGHNLGVRIKPIDGKLTDGSRLPCPVVDCVYDISQVCSGDLVAGDKDGRYIGCYSACDKLNDPAYCCTGAFAGPACQPNRYSEMLKRICALSHTYPGDINPPIYQCGETDRYEITFCPE